MSKIGRTWEWTDKTKLAEAVKMIVGGRDILAVANHLGLKYGPVYRAYKKYLRIPNGNTGEEKNA